MKDALDQAVDNIIAEEAKRSAAEAAEKAARLTQVRRDAMECWRRIAGPYADCLPLVEIGIGPGYIRFSCEKPGYEPCNIQVPEDPRVGITIEYGDGDGIWTCENPADVARAFRSLRIEEKYPGEISRVNRESDNARITQLQDEIACMMQKTESCKEGCKYCDTLIDEIKSKRTELAALQGATE